MAVASAPKSKIAYLGPPASYTHQAAVDSFEEQKFALDPQVSIRDVFATVQSSNASFGVVPFENSSNGSVLETLDLLIDKEKDFPDIEVCAETYVNVQHCLLGHVHESMGYEGRKSQASTANVISSTMIPYPREPRAKPLADLKHIKRIHSHPQAFGQSEAFLSTYLKLAKRHDLSSTSEAANIVALDKSGESAAVASRLAANVHGLSVLAEGIQDAENNSTRFLIIQKGPTPPGRLGLLPEKFHVDPNSNPDRKALVAFSINHETKGALAKVLLIFKQHNLNLTSINSRPSRIRPWHYIFLVEFEGKEELRDPELLHIGLEELNMNTEGNKWLGCWVDRFVR
ncbi:prephenate dehydratase [Lecanora helva]